MNKTYNFPFGQELKKVEQKDKTPKKAFVLGVYASAVHARWLDKDGKQKVSALAVASEPEIFWTGNYAEEIISKIWVPEQLGQLTIPKDKRLNGPSGRALDNLFLEPLGLDRSTSWLCDLLPESRVNEHQRNAINKHYSDSIISEYGLSKASIPDFDKSELNSKSRRDEILEELETSQAKNYMSIGVLVRTTKFAARNNGIGVRQESNPQSPMWVAASVSVHCKNPDRRQNDKGILAA